MCHIFFTLMLSKFYFYLPYVRISYKVFGFVLFCLS